MNMKGILGLLECMYRSRLQLQLATSSVGGRLRRAISASANTPTVMFDQPMAPSVSVSVLVPTDAMAQSALVRMVRIIMLEYNSETDIRHCPYPSKT